MQSVPESPRKAKRKSRRLLYWGIAVLVLAGLCVRVYLKSKEVKPIMVTVEPAARRTIIQLVSATGKIQPETEVKISPGGRR